MKILFTSHVNVSCGSTTALGHIIRGMKERGHQVLVATCMQEGPFLQMLDEIGCQYTKTHLRSCIYPINKNPLLYLPRILWMKWCIKKAQQEITDIIREYKPDIVHTNVGPLSVAFEACKKLGVPHVWHHREYQDLDFNYQFFPSIRSFLRKTHSKGNYNICITKGIFNYRNFRENTDKIIYDGVFGQEAIKNIPQQKKEDYILFAGRIEKAKGALELIQAFAILHKTYSNVILKIAGTYHEKDSYYRSCIQEIDKNNLRDSVEFLGERKDIYHLMSKALMLVVPSRFEGFGFITAEAMLNGCPVIGRNTAGTKEQFDKGLEYTGKEIGLRFNNQEELIQCMKQILQEDSSEMCKNARETVIHFYTIEENVRNIEKYYQEILSIEHT